jgi:M6 family metalloprotease-like protein
MFPSQQPGDPQPQPSPVPQPLRAALRAAPAGGPLIKWLKLSIVVIVSVATLLLGACAPTTVVLWQNYPHLWPSATRHPFLVIKCTLSDVPDVPAGLDDKIAQFLTVQGQQLGNMLDYYSDVSYGAISLSGSTVVGWYPAPFSSTSTKVNRYDRVVGCANAVPRGAVDFSAYYGIILVQNQPIIGSDGGGACSNGQKPMQIQGQNYPHLACVAFDNLSLYTQFAAHEVGHALGMRHAYDNTQIVCGQGAKPGEYCDPWDIMGGLTWDNTGDTTGGYKFAGHNFPDPYGHATYDGPGLNAPNLLQMGWIPDTRIGTYNSGDVTTTFKLAALSHPTAPGVLTVKIIVPIVNIIPTLGSKVYTVEYRQKDGWDAGIPENAVLIHEYRQGASPYSYLQRNTYRISGEWLPGMGWADPSNQVQVCVNSIDASAAKATITIGPVGSSPSLFGCSSSVPRVQILAPASGSHVTAGVPFQLVARATIWDGTPLPDAAVIWQTNGNTLGTGHTLTTSLSPAGTYTVTVTATDPSNTLSASDSLTLYVDPPSPPPAKPTVEILSPTNGAQYLIKGLDGSITLALSSQASAGVTSYLWSDSLTLFTDSHANDTLTLTPPTSQISCNVPFSDVVTLKVTDRHGQTASASATISLERVCLT